MQHLAKLVGGRLTGAGLSRGEMYARNGQKLGIQQVAEIENTNLKSLSSSLPAFFQLVAKVRHWSFSSG